MKTTLCILVGIFMFCGTSWAQLNPGLESWTGAEPDSWYTNNQFTTILGVNGLFVEQDTSASEGAFSAKLITKTCPNCPANGLPNPATGFMDQVEPFSGMPLDSIKFDYKYIPAAATDTGYFQMRLTHWVQADDSSSIDYYADYVISAHADWTTASSSFITNPVHLGIPDTLDIAFFTSLGGLEGVGTDTDGSALYIDNIRFVSMTTGVEESLEDVLSIQVYPNPVVDYVIFEVENEDVQSVAFFDLSGNMVHQQSLFNGTTTVEFPPASAGTYFYLVSAKDGRQMRSGKIVVRAE